MSTELTVAAALVFALTTIAVVVFQIALALGAPLGEYAMGGRFQGRFPPAMRVAALVQGVLLGALAFVVASGTGLVAGVDWTRPVLIWVPVAVSALALFLNAITPSAGERRIWVPVTLVMLATSFLVAISPPR